MCQAIYYIFVGMKTRVVRKTSPLDNTYYLLHHMSFIFDKELDAVLKERVNIGVSQFKILSVLETWPYSQQRSIAKLLGLDESGVSRHIAWLCKKRFVQKKANQHDRRQQLITLTQNGAHVLSLAHDIRESVTDKMLSAVSLAERRQLHATLQRLHRRACTPETGCEQYIR